jgi:hypothetical protein
MAQPVAEADAARAGGPGQASLELLAGLPVLLLAGLLCLQLLGVGYSLTLADGAAEAGALAVAAGLPAGPAARAGLPGWSRSRVSVITARGTVVVRLRPPSPLRAMSRWLVVSSTAWARRPAGRR